MIIPKLSNDTYVYNGSFQTGMFYSPNLTWDRAASFSTNTIYIPHASGMGQIDVSGFTSPSSNFRGLVNNRAYNTVNTTGMVVQYTNDLSGVIDTVGTITPTVTTTASASTSFTYNALAFTWAPSALPCLADAGDGVYLLAGCTSAPSVSHPDVFCWHWPTGGTPTMLKAFQMPINGTDFTGNAGATILGTIPYGSGTQRRYKSVTRVFISGAFKTYVVDWAPTSITNTIYDATTTEITLSDGTDQADLALNSGTGVYAYTSKYGLFLDLNYTISGVYTGKHFQFDPSLEFYRELTETGITTSGGSLLRMMANDEGGLQIVDQDSRLYGNGSGKSLTMSVPRVRAWGFSLDDHDFYVVQLNDTETLVYDVVTGQWCTFLGPLPYWRAMYGVNWQGATRASYDSGLATTIVTGDTDGNTLWSLDPDQGWDDQVSGDLQDPIMTRATAGIPIRGSKAYRVFRVFLTLQGGDPGISPGTVNLSVSDDNGVSFKDFGNVTIQDDNPEQDIVWRSLGTMDQPGRIFQFSDNGASARWDGSDVEAENLGDKDNPYA